MTLRLEMVTPQMQEIARTVSTALDSGYYLAGGTALALRLGHRKSVDLDYFIAHPIATPSLKTQLVESFGSDVQIAFEEKNTLWSVIRQVKVSFISRFETLLDEVEPQEGFALAGIRDITVMKLGAICGREEYKDYIDLACLARHTDPRSWISWWQEVYPNQDFTSWLVALSAISTAPLAQTEVYGEYCDVPIASTLIQTAKDITAYAEHLFG